MRSRTIGIGIAIVVVAAGLAALVWYVTRDTAAEVDIGAPESARPPRSDAHPRSMGP